MKLSRIVFTVLLITNLLGASAHAADSAGYIRFWRGFRKADVTQNAFELALPAFMSTTTSLYGNALNNYLVALPPSEKPAFVPEEFALLLFGSEADYQKIRATPEGKAYGDSHWEIFAKETSRSLSPARQIPDVLAEDASYDLSPAQGDWRKGATTFFIGVRKPGLTKEVFLSRMSRHVKQVAAAFADKGLKGYIIAVNGDYEAAYMNWESAEAMQAAFATAEGQAVQADAGEIIDVLQWSNAEVFDGRSVTPSRLYDTSSGSRE